MSDIKSNISDWWSDNPMTYGNTHGKTEYDNRSVKYELGELDFFKKADETFINWNKPLHKDKYFDRIFPFDEYKIKKILEIGCGMGFMSSLWAVNNSYITAVDLNPVAIEQTKRRFELFGLKGIIIHEDANKLSFDDNSFDYVYSWGVLHHSPNFENSISEVFRVLKPGNRFGIMIYNRNSILYRYFIKFIEGVLHNENKFLNELELASRYSDGGYEEGNPYTWPMTAHEIKVLFAKYSYDVKIRILGTDLDHSFRHLLVGFDKLMPKVIIKSWARRYGWSLWISGSKKCAE